MFSVLKIKRYGFNVKETEQTEENKAFNKGGIALRVESSKSLQVPQIKNRSWVKYYCSYLNINKMYM